MSGSFSAAAVTGDRWDRSETRRVRPFRDARACLQDAMLRLSDDGDFSAEESRQLDEVDTERVAPVVRLEALPADIERVVGAPVEELQLIVIIEDRFFKRSTVVHAQPVSVGECIEIDLRHVAKEAATWRAETRLHVAVILAKDRDAPIGYARRRGSWLAKKTFRIARGVNVRQFPVRSVDAEWLRSQGLPETTAYVVDILGDLASQTAEELSGAIEVLVNEDVMNALAASASSPMTKTVILFVYTDIVTAVLTAGFDGLDGDPEPGSILEGIVDRLSRSGGFSRDEIMSAARDKERTTLRALVQSQVRLTHSVIESSRRRAV